MGKNKKLSDFPNIVTKNPRRSGSSSSFDILLYLPVWFPPYINSY